MFPGCVVLKNDPNYLQGIPDLTIFWNNRWATLEVKKEANAPHQPNQDYYVAKMDDMSFSRFIYPENKKEVLNELQQSFRLS
jgi:3-hydroxymyristoyl/3-hydroxydecanoyl-(acyl carrier protein) dehydratase